jgi:hypothetical protein
MKLSVENWPLLPFMILIPAGAALAIASTPAAFFALAALFSIVGFGVWLVLVNVGRLWFSRHKNQRPPDPDNSAAG